MALGTALADGPTMRTFLIGVTCSTFFVSFASSAEPAFRAGAQFHSSGWIHTGHNIRAPVGLLAPIGVQLVPAFGILALPSVSIMIPQATPVFDVSLVPELSPIPYLGIGVGPHFRFSCPSSKGSSPTRAQCCLGECCGSLAIPTGASREKTAAP